VLKEHLKGLKAQLDLKELRVQQVHKEVQQELKEPQGLRV
jgi:hypothetical protein